MRAKGLAFLCLQETRTQVSGSREVGNGYLLMTSGADDGKRTFAGVGFLIAPWIKHSIFTFQPLTERLCCLKLRVQGGKASFFNVCAPHGGYDFNVRQTYYSSLCDAMEKCRGLKSGPIDALWLRIAQLHPSVKVFEAFERLKDTLASALLSGANAPMAARLGGGLRGKGGR